ncbi:hypothetical protein SDC9_159293 [bioreactor metagenome]|jgi:nitric oxide reductase subunit C|uniref:Cytochrome c domain-containing protein n=1 Tax=bioreactor metagenome TaxID=1076179 RepID=A0A645FHN8_9ZZZZ
MKFVLNSFLVVLSISLIAFFGAIYSSVAGNKLQSMTDQELKGKHVFEQRACIECHTLFGNGGYSGGDLTKAYGNFGEVYLKEYFLQPPLISGAKSKKHISLSPAETDLLIAYLRFVNSVNTVGWPPAVQNKQAR